MGQKVLLSAHFFKIGLSTRTPISHHRSKAEQRQTHISFPVSRHVVLFFLFDKHPVSHVSYTSKQAGNSIHSKVERLSPPRAFHVPLPKPCGAVTPTDAIKQASEPETPSKTSISMRRVYSRH